MKKIYVIERIIFSIIIFGVFLISNSCVNTAPSQKVNKEDFLELISNNTQTAAFVGYKKKEFVSIAEYGNMIGIAKRISTSLTGNSRTYVEVNEICENVKLYDKTIDGYSNILSMDNFTKLIEILGDDVYDVSIIYDSPKEIDDDIAKQARGSEFPHVFLVSMDHHFFFIKAIKEEFLLVESTISKNPNLPIKNKASEFMIKEYIDRWIILKIEWRE